MSRTRTRIYLLALLFAATTACDCEDQIRKLVSNSGDRDRRMPTSTSGTVSGPAESEPNDDPTRASAFTLKGELRDITGAITTVDDVDWYAFALDEGEAAFQLEVVPSADLDISVHVEVEGSSALSYDEGRRGDTERIGALKLSTRPQRLVIRPQSGTTGSYTIRFRRQLAADGLEAEPNDEASVATVFSFPGEMRGTYDRPDDRDVYRLTGDANKPFHLEIGAIAGGRHIARVFDDPRLSTPLLTVQVVDGPMHIPNLVLDAERPRFLVLTPLGTPPAGHVYQLRAVAHPPIDTLLEHEPNDQTPQPIPFSETGDAREAVVAGYLHAADDRDRFEFTPPRLMPRATPIPRERDGEDRLEQFRTKAQPQVPISAVLTWASDQSSFGLRWLGADGADVDFRQSSPTLEVRACGLNLDAGPATIEVRAERLGAAPRIGVPQYTLTVVETSAGESFEAEPNNLRTQADILETARRGTFAVPDDVDVFAFAVDGAPEDERTVKIDAHAPQVDIVLRILDDSGGVVANVDSGQIGSPERVELDLPAGLYFAELRWKGGELCAPYTIELTTR